MRKVIAKRLTESKQQIPHAYCSIQCTISKLMKLRKELAKGISREICFEAKSLQLPSSFSRKHAAKMAENILDYLAFQDVTLSKVKYSKQERQLAIFEQKE